MQPSSSHIIRKVYNDNNTKNKTLRYTLLDVESNTQCGVTSHAFPPRWTNDDFFEYDDAGDVDGEYDDADVAVGEYYDDVDNEEECVNYIW